MPRAALRLSLVAVAVMSSVSASTQSAPVGPRTRPSAGRAATSFRHYPGGKDLPALRLGRTRADAMTALRVEGDDQLPPQVRVRADAAPAEAAAGSRRLLRFGLDVGGVPVVGGDFVAVLGASGRMLASRTRGVPQIVDATAPTNAGADAAAAAIADAQRRTPGATLLATTPELRIVVDPGGRGRLAWVLVVRGTRDGIPFARRYRLSATGAAVVLASDDLVRDASVQVTAPVWGLSPLAPPVVSPLPHVTIAASTTATTDASGTATFPSLMPGTAIVGLLRGPYADVFTDVGPRLTASAVATGGADVLPFTAASEFTLAQTTAFVSTSRASRWVRDRLPFLDGIRTTLDQLRVDVNANFTCNAFSAGGLIAFGRAAGSCQNMATPTVVTHEFGHEVHIAMASDLFDAAYSEGFGDALSALVTDQPCLAVDALGPGTCIRNAAETTTWPVAGDDPHDIGRPYAQFVWALRNALGTEVAAQLTLAAAVAAPDDIPDAVYLTFVADDDDGLLGTCSPHQAVLQAAADSRGLPRPQTCRGPGDNAAPTAVDDRLTLAEDAAQTAVDLVGNDTDPDGDALEVGQVQPSALGHLTCARHGCTFEPHPDATGVETLVYTAIDTFGGSATATIRIEIIPEDDPLRLFVVPHAPAAEDEPVELQAVAFDPDNPVLALQWVVSASGGPAPCTFTAPTSPSTTITCTHDGVYEVGVVAVQAGTATASALVPLEILNVHPNVSIASPVDGAAIVAGSTAGVVAAFDDGPTAGPHTCAVSWGDGSVTPGTVSGGTCSGSHTFAAGATGPRLIVVSVTDPGGAAGVAVVSVTVTPPAGAACPGGAPVCVAVGAGTLGPTSPLAFELTASIVRGVATGQIAVTDLRTTSFAGLARSVTIAVGAATLRGQGSLNGRGGFTFEAVAVDRRPGRDTLQIVIRNAAGTVVRTIGGEVIRGEIVVR